jgi:methionyl aminopeptidase
MSIALRKPNEIEKIRAASRLVAKTLSILKKRAEAGVSLLDLEKIAVDFLKEKGARPSFKGLYGFPAALCTSVNQVVIHGIPTSYKLKDGDIVGFDIGVEIDGWYGDGAITVGIGNISEQDKKLIECAKETLHYAVSIIRPGLRFKELSYKIEKFIKSRGFFPLYGFCGHGIGRKPHEEPEIPNYLEHGSPKSGPKIKNGMVFCVEPMICQKSSVAKILSDKWSVTSEDGLNTAHWEHTIAVINGKAEVLTIE